MAVSKRTRFEVLRRDNHTCRYCHSTDNPLTIDHVVPVTLGGTDDPSNLVACCRDCNAGKSSSAPDAALVDEVSEDAIRWARAMRKAQEFAAFRRQEEADRARRFTERWAAYTYPNGSSVPMPSTAPATVLSMLDSGLTFDDIDEAIAVAMGKRNCDDRFRYFCGVAWNKLRDLQAAAKAFMDAEEVQE